jgi:hypothetical protein
MSWPMKLRALSFGIGIAVVMGEVALVAIPIGIALWIEGVATAMRIAQVEAAIALATALIIIVPGHIRAARIVPAARNGVTR